MPITPARLAWTADGTPYSEHFDDVYHSRDGGLGQARNVFLAGNGLPERWRGRERFVVFETGFGLGLNFLAAWAAWREDPQRCRRLHFVSCELHPFLREDLARLHARWPELAPLAAELQSRWPPAAPGVHRLELDGDRVCLTLYFGDAREGLDRLALRADAFFLDGFSPAKNPELWSPRVFHQLARLAAPGATLATWSVAGAVREGLRRAGFEVAKAPGFGGKRQMLRGVLAPRRPAPERDAGALAAAAAIAHLPSDVTRPPASPSPSPSPSGAGDATRHALVIGAGIAGTSVAERLAARGWTVEVIDAAARAGAGASGNHAGVLRPLPNLDDNRMSRLTRAGTLYGLRHLARLAARGLPVRFEACGVLQLARDAAQRETMAAVVERLALPTEMLRFVDAAEAGELAGWPLNEGGWWFPGSAWVQPPSLCAANLAAHPQRIRTHFGKPVAGLRRARGQWLARDAAGETIAAAPVAILAAGARIGDFPAAAALPVGSARGQVALLPAATDSAPRVVVCRGGYVSPAIDGLRCAGATFAMEDADETVRTADQRENLDKLEAMLPGYTAGLDPATLAGRVGFRPTSPDRLPMVGALPGRDQPPALAKLAEVVREPGLYAVSGFGARGLVWATLIAELLASQLEDEPLPLERDLVDALDPARWLLRGAARPRRHAQPPV